MNRTALIDADELSYKIALQYQTKYYTVLRDDKVLWKCRYKEDAIESIENATDLDIGEYIEIYELKGHEDKINQSINSICNHTSSNDNKLFLSGSDNFRFKLATLLPYKGHRPERPVHLQAIKDAFTDRGAESVDFLEADDLLSIYSFILPNSVIASSDKDLRTVPSLNYNISKGVLSVISEEEATYNFFYQLLVGDPVDNIPSPYGLGAVAAKKFLEKEAPRYSLNYYNTFKSFYYSHLKRQGKDKEYKTSWYSGQDLDEILSEIGNLLWMRRTLDPNEKWGIS